MRIPNDEKNRDKRIIKVLDTCKESLRDRRLRYEKRRRWLLFANDSEQPARYNRLLAHSDLVSSFLFAPDSIRFTLTMSGSQTPLDPDIMETVSDHMRTAASNADLFQQYSDAILWALCYDSMFMKLGWSMNRKQVLAKIVDPYSFAVYDETEQDLDEQEGFAHFFVLPWAEAVRRMMRAGKGNQIKQLYAQPEGKADEDYPPVYRSLLISQTGGQNISGTVIGQAQAEYQAPTDYRGNVPPDQVKAAELWIWDDDCQDYRQFLIMGDEIIVSDSKDHVDLMKARAPKATYGTKCNGFLPGEQPFIHICPYRIYDYFWGECHTERLIPLQEWTNQRLEQISDILERQVDPARSFTGFSGLSQEKAIAFGGPHSWVSEQNPSAKVDEHKPDMPPDLFAEFEHIGQLFMEASGLTETITGQGSHGVRSQSHAKQLATTGSGRIKKAAYGLESSLSKLGDLFLKLDMHNSETSLMTAAGLEMITGQIEGDVDVRVAGHSHSPLFQDDTKDLAGMLYKFSAIDKESLLKLMNPPGVENLVQRLRQMEKQKAQQQQQAAATGQKPDTKAEDEAKRSHHSAREKGVGG